MEKKEPPNDRIVGFAAVTTQVMQEGQLTVRRSWIIYALNNKPILSWTM